MTKTMTTMAALAAAVLAGGCMTEDEDTALGETAQALEDLDFHALSVSGTTTGTKDLGTALGRACFLTAVRGDISISAGQLNTYAGASITVAGGHLILSVTPASGDVTAEAVCVDYSGGSNIATWTTGQAPQLLTAIANERRCFLTALSTSKNQTYLAGGLHTDSDQVSITSSGGNYYLGGSTSGRVSATARCIGLAHDWGGHAVWAPAGSTVSSSVEIHGNDTICALQRVVGHFDAAGTGLDMSRVVGPSLEIYSRLYASNASGGTMRCVD